MLVTGGCLSSQRIQMPTCFYPPEQVQRRAAQVQDPYPDASLGPNVGFRPLGFVQQRSESQQVKDRYYSGFLKSHFGGSQPTPVQSSAAPMMGPQMGAPRMASPPPQMMSPQMANPAVPAPIIYQ